MERQREMRKGRRERIEKGSRDRIEIERKETRGNRDDNLKRRRRNNNTCLCLLFSFLRHCISPKFPMTRFCSKALQQ